MVKHQVHLASGCSHTHIVQYLLSTCKVDQLAKIKNGKTSVDIASQQDNSFDLLKLIQSMSTMRERISCTHIHKSCPNWIQWSWQDL